MVMNREPQHEYLVNDQDHTQMNGGDVTHAIDDGKGMEAHKQEVNDQGNSKANDNNVTHVQLGPSTFCLPNN